MNQLMILADIDIAGVPFRLQYRYGKEKNELTFSWQRPRAATMGLSGLSAALQGTPLGFSVPEQLDGLASCCPPLWRSMILKAMPLPSPWRRKGTDR